ncbi:hypothetical protein N7481_008900 [Penicillium waksmanii]|uniref:uncharacterized protein n=1 Tax=Penicillium waksmanii TaxID=69791 RepID=UPI0025478632|nr:uncharacterized protein N7481_008900 [Penicillium waksmanii]KAJ5975193.1 hypothetical protein N7481_008900 [Penicillium waksmanii]
MFVGTRVSWGDLPVATNLTSFTPIATPSTAPLAKKTRLDCEEYKDNLYGSVPCDWLALGVNLPDFATWNPSLDVYDCMLTNNTRYCTLLGTGYNTSKLNTTVLPYVDVPSGAAVNSTPNCYSWYHTSKATPCDEILSFANIAFDAFYAWNPSVKSDCSNIWLNVSYCIDGDGFDDTSYPSSSTQTTSTPTSASSCTGASATAPGPTQSGIPCDCNKYAMHDDDVYCQGMADKYDITLAELYKLNPALNGDCSGLWAGYAYCIGTPGLSTSVPATTTNTAPTATSSGNCANVTPPKYLMHDKDGVYCYDIAQDSDISLDELCEWNPALNGNCSGLWLNYAYCIGVQ